MENNLHLQFSSGRPSPLIRGPNSPDWSGNWRWVHNKNIIIYKNYVEKYICNVCTAAGAGGAAVLCAGEQPHGGGPGRGGLPALQGQVQPGGLHGQCLDISIYI